MVGHVRTFKKLVGALGSVNISAFDPKIDAFWLRVQCGSSATVGEGVSLGCPCTARTFPTHAQKQFGVKLPRRTSNFRSEDRNKMRRVAILFTSKNEHLMRLDAAIPASAGNEDTKASVATRRGTYKQNESQFACNSQ